MESHNMDSHDVTSRDMNAYGVIDPEGDIFLIVEERQGRVYTRLSEIFSDHQVRSTLPSPSTAEESETIDLDESSSLSRESSPDPSVSDLVSSTLLDGDSEQDAPDKKTKIRVSSKHLAFASPRFQDMLESSDGEFGRIERDLLPAGFDNLSAVLVLLNVIHGCARKVPRSLDPETLCMVAMLAEHYECLEAVEVYFENWVRNIEDRVPRVYTDDLSIWLYIAWTFKHQMLFKHVTRIAVRESTGPVPTLDLPIPKKLIEHIETLRQYRVTEILKSLFERLEYLLEHKNCCQDCDMMLVGSLVCQMKAQGLLPQPEDPFLGFSVECLLAKVGKMKETRCKDLIHPANGCPVLGCLMMPKTRVVLNRVDDELTGLELTWCVL
ncbi:hypothetical protein BO71DRAFT_403400 [Aspergillus ellipticus CBS 707.79]|uniref:BTB domain-containing protein n=1 Tax=Aspergillus ellipticus CBS 707.79 TaxID=1448320 RepID=A0A319ED86_9EURO|nr:hypothetical protein BO71DRAFT_403400 [Aspergillus ellipticus CBS 707.79]